MREAGQRTRAADAELVAIDRALAALRDINSELSRVVECHLFGGMGLDEIGEVLGLPPRAVRKRWAEARTLLLQAVEGKPVK